MTDQKITAERDLVGSSIVSVVRLSDDMFAKKPELLPCVFYGYTMSLVRSSASRIYLATFEEQQSVRLQDLVNGLPPLLATRVKVIDRDQRVFTALCAVMDPIHAEAKYLWDKEFPKGSDVPVPGHEHTACLLHELIYLLILGQVYGAEVDFDVILAQHCVTRLRKRLSSREGCASLARIEAITHAYSKTSQVSSLVPLTESPELRSGSLLRDLLEDARWIDATVARHDIGILGRLHSACANLQKRLTDLLRDPSKQRYLSLGRQFVTTAAEKAPIPLPIPLADSTLASFSPPLQCLDGIRPHCIGTTRWFPFSPAEIGTDRYLQPQDKLCPVGFLFEAKGKTKGKEGEDSSKPDAGDGK